VIVLLTDADRFPFSSDDTELLEGASLTLRSLDGHDRRKVAHLGRNADALFVYHAKIDQPLIEQLDACRVIIRCGSGFDNIDVEAARTRGIEVVNVPGATTDDVANHTIALLLVCARKLIVSDRAIRAGDWPTWPSLEPMHRLAGRTIGLVGLGSVGQAVAKRAKALRMQVIGYDPYLASGPLGGCELVDDVAALLRRSDFISLHAPLTDETTNLIGTRSIEYVRPGTVLINTARGALVDEAVLIDALSTGRLSAAGLDVFRTEPLDFSSPLRRLDNVVLTSHSAAFSEEGLAYLRRQAIEEAIRVLSGESAHHPVPA